MSTAKPHPDEAPPATNAAPPPAETPAAAPAAAATAGSAGSTTGMLQRVGKGATGIVAFVASLLSVVFVLWPALKPDEPAPARSARLSNVTLEPNLSFGQYLDRIDQSRKPFPRSELEQRVAFAQFDFTIEGYKDKRLPLRWQLFDVRTGDRLAQARDVYITAVANRDSGTWQIYAPLPRGARRRLQFEIQLYDDRNAVPLSRVRTQQFPGLR